jgi:hypothetical protein
VHVTHDGFQFVDVGEKALATAFSNAVDRYGTPGAGLLLRRNDPELVERVHVPIEISIGQVASCLKVAETQPGRMRDQARANRKPSAFVKDAF